MPPIPDEFLVDGKRPKGEAVTIDGRSGTRYTYTAEAAGFTASATIFADAPGLVDLEATAASGERIAIRRVARAELRDAVRVGWGQVRAFLLDGSYADLTL
jgi:hypothetical protein